MAESNILTEKRNKELMQAAKLLYYHCCSIDGCRGCIFKAGERICKLSKYPYRWEIEEDSDNG